MVAGPHSLKRELVGLFDHIRKFSISRSLVDLLVLPLVVVACSSKRSRSSPSIYVAARANADLRWCSSDEPYTPSL